MWMVDMARWSARCFALPSEPAMRPHRLPLNDAVPVSPFEAFRRVCSAYGVAEMAARIGLKPGTLWNKCDADVESHHQPTLRDVIAVTRESGDMRVLDSLNRLFDRASYDVAPGAASDEALLDLLCKVGSDSGHLHAAVGKALADGQFTQQDLVAVRAEAFDLVSSVLCFVQRLEGLVDE